MRTYQIGRDNSYPRLEELRDEVVNAGFSVPRFIREFGVYDSAIQVDNGWLEPITPISNVVGFLPRW